MELVKSNEAGDPLAGVALAYQEVAGMRGKWGTWGAEVDCKSE